MLIKGDYMRELKVILSNKLLFYLLLTDYWHDRKWECKLKQKEKTSDFDVVWLDLSKRDPDKFKVMQYNLLTKV